MPQDFVPRPYQKYAIEQILNKPAIALMLDMGLGKSVITLTAVQYLMYDSFEVNRCLVIAPLRVAESTWTDEQEKWSHLKDVRLSRVLGSNKERLIALKREADIYVINRENVQWLVELYKSKWPFDMVVIDESSSFKNHQSKRFKELKRVRPLINRIVELTGTPAPNGMMDMWSQIYLLDKGERLGKTIGAFRKKYFTPGSGLGHVVYNWLLNKGADKEITERISDICVSMKSEDYLALPEIIYNTVKVKLSDEAMKKYKRLECDLVLSVNNDDIVASSAGVLSNKLLQMANGLVYSENEETIDIHSAKVDALKELVESNEYHSIMVFYWYKHDLARLKEAFPKAVELKTADDIKKWNSGKIKMMLVHPASAGHGLNLQYGGNIIVWYGLIWSLELYQQANKRLHRSGQKETVIIHHLVAEGTIDEDVMQALECKNAGQAKLLEAVKVRLEKYGKIITIGEEYGC